MTAFALKSMINNHDKGTFARIFDTLHAWHDRSVQRAELARLNELQLHDIGLSRSGISAEIDKPFWRP